MRVRGPARVVTGAASSFSFREPGPPPTISHLARGPAGGKHAPTPPSPLICRGSTVSSGEKKLGLVDVPGRKAPGRAGEGLTRARGSELPLWFPYRPMVGREAPTPHEGSPRITAVPTQDLGMRHAHAASDTRDSSRPPLAHGTRAGALPRRSQDAAALARSVRCGRPSAARKRLGRSAAAPAWPAIPDAGVRSGRKAPAWPAAPDVPAEVAEGRLPILPDLIARRRKDGGRALGRGRAWGAGRGRS